jgi:hypothetical protein
MTQTVEEATKALWDYIGSLEPGQREKAIAYQRSLEAEAAKTEGGMMAVIPKRLAHARASLIEALDEVREIATDYIATSEIKRIMK